VPWGMVQSVAKGAVFSWGQAQSASMLHETTWLTREQKTVASGGMGGFVQGIVLSPLLLLKTRVMTDPIFRTTGGLLQTAVASARVSSRRAGLPSAYAMRSNIFYCRLAHGSWLMKA
jgi:hypothetical protein